MDAYLDNGPNKRYKPKNISSLCLIVIIRTRTKVVQKNVSQDFDKMYRS